MSCKPDPATKSPHASVAPEKFIYAVIRVERPAARESRNPGKYRESLDSRFRGNDHSSFDYRL
jgi:hypothetical protein